MAIGYHVGFFHAFRTTATLLGYTGESNHEALYRVLAMGVQRAWVWSVQRWSYSLQWSWYDLAPYGAILSMAMIVEVQ